jgi:hypothetical protein
MGEICNRFSKILVEKPEEKRPLGKPMRRCEDKIKMYLKEIGNKVKYGFK